MVRTFGPRLAEKSFGPFHEPYTAGLWKRVASHLPRSKGRATALKALEEHDIQMVGRYARWMFQGIADSLRDGLYVGAANRWHGGKS